MTTLLDKINVICKSLEKLVIIQKVDICNWKYKKGNYITFDEANKDSNEWLDFETKTMHWYGKDGHYWFSKNLTVPKSFEGKSLWFRVNTQINEFEDGKNPQFLIFINDVPCQGMDINHKDVLILDKAKAGEVYKIDLQAYTGTVHTEFNLNSCLYEKSSLIDKLYWDLLTPLKGLSKINDNNLSKLKLIEALNNTINLIDFREPYSSLFYNSINEAENYIQKAVYTDLVGNDGIIASCIGHTHIDVAWWWTVEQTQEKVCRSFATVLELMKEYPTYKFMSSQPLLYSFVKERYPELYLQIKERVKEGRWEVEGGMWVEADCNLPSGESLVRQFLYGMDFFEKEFGKENKILWLPDAFGFSAALPQILKKVGIKYFMTTKLSWNETNKFPQDTFKWVGLDGSSVLAYFVTTQEPNQKPENFHTTYNGLIDSETIITSWNRYQNKNINNDILISFGYGDGGGGPSRKMLETSKRLEKGIVGFPKVRQITSRKYFEELSERLSNKEIPSWEGELYFEYHRGCYTSMARNKRSNRKTENLIMDTELLSVISENEIPYPKQELSNIWLLTLRNQFHDILPGSAIHEVYEVTKKEYGEIEKELSQLIQNSLKTISSEKMGITLFNTTGFSRSQIVEIPTITANSIVDNDGNIYAIQKDNNVSIVNVKNLPSKGYRSYTLSDKKINIKNSFIINNNSIENSLIRVSFNKDGTISSIWDKKENREIIEKGTKANLFRMFEDKPIRWDNWNIDSYYSEKYWDATSFSKFEWIEKGPLRATLLIERKISNSLINQKIYFYVDSKKIDFETYVEYHEKQHLLKVLFPTNIHTDEATFDIQFGNIKRKTNTNTSWDEAKFEVCGHKWIDVSEGHYGVSLLNDCKYGHSVRNGKMELTLIKTGIEPNPTADQESHFFTYSLFPHCGTWREGETVKNAYFLNQKVLTIPSQSKQHEYSLASVDKSNVVIETIKKAEDRNGYIIRLFECENSLTNAKLFINLKFSEAFNCNLREKEENRIPFNDNFLSITIKPYEILTIRIR